MIDAIQANKVYLSEVDGAIGDGDHGINMAKGFGLAGERLSGEMGFSEALNTLGRTLVMEIGGAMGPLYGSFFKAMARVGRASRLGERSKGVLDAGASSCSEPQKH
ncbi:MAG: DAK2 domain-containing protein [Spirochaetales bacterium]|nr:DAK2 domain-containing protein [Spirochaetales bacterium]